jgi:cytochrome c1
MNLKNTAIALVTLAISSSAWAYQVTGPVLEVTDSKIVVQKGKEKWEIARTADTKVSGDLKVGAKVTIEYTMAAKSVEVKGEKGKKK